MPVIIVKDYKWRQTSDMVIIDIPVMRSSKKTDFFVTDNYVKVSYQPFLLELFLWSDVNEESSNCIVSEDKITLSLLKRDNGKDWPDLQPANLSKEAKQSWRNEAIERAQKVAEERKKMKAERKRQLREQAVKAQIELDSAERDKISELKNSYRSEAMKEFDDWRVKSEIPIFEGVKGQLQENRKANRTRYRAAREDIESVKIVELTEEEAKSRNEATTAARENRSAKTEEADRNDKANERAPTIEKPPRVETIKSEAANENDESEEDENHSDSISDGIALPESEQRRKTLIRQILAGKLRKAEIVAVENIPLPRESATISVSFSERAFPTPARESSHAEEQEWLAKQAEARRKTGFVVENLTPEEQDPLWLKDKGDEFFRVKNYLGAISAYSHGIKISDKMASLYVNRSAAHYALENYYKCVDDCNTALKLMTPKCEANRESRARCHARLGAALCKLSAPQHGIPELEAALKLTPGNDSIKLDLQNAREHYNIKS